MLKFKCPNCRISFTAENYVAGHNLACECGEKWHVPELPAEGDFSVCPKCGHADGFDAVLCTQCGFSFRTGRMPGENVPESAAASGSRSCSGRVVMLVLLAVLLAAAGAVWYGFSRSKIGRSGEFPLGRIGASCEFNGVKFSPFRPGSREESPLHASEGTKLFAFTQQPANVLTPGSSLFLAAGPDGRVKAVSGMFVTGTNLLGFSLPVSSARLFFDRLCSELKLAPLNDWKSHTEGEGILRRTVSRIERKTDSWTFECTRSLSSSGQSVTERYEFSFRLNGAPPSAGTEKAGAP